ncbi:MAG: hypothetical protein QM831_37675 [Kofleriaceae bacterium]
MSESQIHDLGYKRYAGVRQEASRRWRVIAQHQMGAMWKGFWRYKAWLITTAMTVVVAAVMIFVATNKEIHLGRGITQTLSNFALPMVFDYGSGKGAFFISLTIGATIIATDRQSNAFVFYFARSTRPIDYLIGKVVGYGAMLAIPFIGAPLLVALMRIGLSASDDISQLLPHLWLIPETLIVGILGTLAYTIMPLTFSALVTNRRYALAIWACWYLIVGTIFAAIGVATHSPVSVIDIGTATKAMIMNMPHAGMPGVPGPSDIPIWACVLSILAQCLIGLGVIYAMLSSAQKSGVGGAT